MIGLHIMRPTSIVVAGGGSETATVRADGGVDFASATSLSLNGVFTADYDNYMISMRSVGSTTGISLRGRLRDSGTDDSTASSYTTQYLLADSTSVLAGRLATNQFEHFGGTQSTQRDGATYFFYGPNLAQPTAMRMVQVESASSADLFDAAGTHNQSTAYDGLTWITSSGSFTGMVTVYGYAQ